MLTRNADQIRRLNIVLGLATPTLDIASLEGVEWLGLQKRLYWALLDDKGPLPKKGPFALALHQGHGLRAAQEGLRGQLHLLKNAAPIGEPIDYENYPRFYLDKQVAHLLVDGEGFFARKVTTDMPTMVYEMLCFLLQTLKLKPADLLTCGNEKCARVFVPLRKPHAKSKKHFCSQKCGNLISARNWRNEKKTEDKLKTIEKARYRKRVNATNYFKTRLRKKP